MSSVSQRRTRKATRGAVRHTMRSVYGEMIVRKGTVLYHSSQTPFQPNPKKPMLFTTLHPSDWATYADEYVTRITPQRDINLFFMIGGICGARILPLLDTLINQPGNNLAKQRDSNLACYTKILKADNFDGWFSSIEGKTGIEIALLNDSSLFSVAPSERVPIHNLNNGDYNANHGYVPRTWGKVFPLTTLDLPVTLHINSWYKPHIEQYMAYIERTNPKEYTFYVLLNNAHIEYTDSPTAFITWDC